MVISIDKGSFWIFFVLMAALVMGLVAGFLPQSDEIRLALLACQQLLFIVGGSMGARGEVFRRPDGKTLACGVVSGVCLYGVNTVLGLASVWFASQVLAPSVVQNLLALERAGVEALLTSNKPLVFFGMVFLLTLGAPLGEELFFRGLMVDLWKERLGTKGAVFLAALLFAFLHFYVLQFVPVLIAGTLLGILFVRTKSIVVPIIAHAVVNTLVLFVWLLAAL
jgi:membrane protease YdiL (CAAX protease family)